MSTQGGAHGTRPLRQLDRHRHVVDGQAAAVQQDRPEQRIGPVAGDDLRLVRFAEPVDVAAERLQWDRPAVRQDRLDGRLLWQPQTDD